MKYKNLFDLIGLCTFLFTDHATPEKTLDLDRLEGKLRRLAVIAKELKDINNYLNNFKL